MPTYELVPATLCRKNLYEVRANLLLEKPWLAPAVKVINSNSDPSLWPINPDAHWDPELDEVNSDKYDTSLTAQLRSVLAHKSKKPDFFAFTMLSAIPIADCIKGVYDVLGEPTPTLLAIRARHREPRANAIYLNGEELDRRGNYLQGMAGCIIDQYEYSGGTLKRAVGTMRSFGANDLSIFRANWFHDAHVINPNINNMSSEICKEMREIGREIGRACMGSTGTARDNDRPPRAAYLNPMGITFTTLL